MRFFTPEKKTVDETKYYDLSPILPENVKGFFLLGRFLRRNKEDIFQFYSRIGIDVEEIVIPKQIHSSLIYEAFKDVECDGLYTKDEKKAICVSSADCVPIMVSIDKGKLIAVMHSGYKGTLPKIVDKFCDLFPTKSFDSVYIGPSIRSCCYKVDSQRIEDFKKVFGNSPFIDEERKTLDLPMLNYSIFKERGVNEDVIFLDGRCSFCGDEDFSSFRRDKEKAGRMTLSIVKI